MKMENKEIFQSNLKCHADVVQKMESVAGSVAAAGEMIQTALKNGGRIFFCGNGGSAADAQHLAAELSGRYLKERRALDGVALHCNTSALTAIANDFSYDEIFARQVEAHGRSGDVLVALSTSGNSKNIIRAIEEAKKTGITTIGMTGADGGKIKALADVIIAIPSNFTPRIQEMHIFVGHILCEMAEGITD
jgi:D-sedoheptulose 7-phosphate isomerase